MPLGKHSRRIQIIIPKEYAKRVEIEARRADKSVSRYLREVFFKTIK